MQNLNFDEGFEEFTINGDKNRVIRFNPADISFIERFNESVKNITAYQNKLKDIPLTPNGDVLEGTENYQQTAELVAESRKFINEQVDYIFGNSVAEKVFGVQSPLSSIKGKFLFERFLECVTPLMGNKLKEESEAQKKHLNKYQQVYHK